MDGMNWERYSLNEIRGAVDALQGLETVKGPFTVLLTQVERVIRTGGTLLLCGNGGSATQALHIAAELTGRFRYERPPYGVIALGENVAALTAIANDYSYDEVFSRQVEAFGQPGDMLIGLTTSGNSRNVLEAVKTAQRQNLFTAVLTGRGGGQAAKLADLVIQVPSVDTAHIQEAHLVMGHIIAGVAEEVLVHGQESRLSGS